MFDPPGFFGKALAYGDFLSRRIPASFLDIWDPWLQRAIHESRQDLGPDWLDAYLTSPIWRFALGAGVCGESSWAGVLMPSVDRVGRYFPLSLVAAGAGDAPLTTWIGQSSAWYEHLEELARTGLDESFDAERMDQELAGVASPVDPLSGLPLEAVQVALVAADDAGSAACRAAAQLGRLPLAGFSFWWTAGAPEIAPALLACRGLPEPYRFSALLNGDWQARGWTPG
jgi:type VI secretion system protein ImpM